MSAKTIFIIIVTVLVTVVLMNNTDEVTFWIFGDVNISKLAILGIMFGLGLIIGYMAGRPKKKQEIIEEPYSREVVWDRNDQIAEEKNKTLSDDDRDYIN